MQLAAEHRGEVFVGVREHVLLGVEVIDGAVEDFAGFAGDFAFVDAAEFAVVAAAHFAVAELVRSAGVICRYAPISRMRSSGPPGGVIASVLTRRVWCVSR